MVFLNKELASRTNSMVRILNKGQVRFIRKRTKNKLGRKFPIRAIEFSLCLCAPAGPTASVLAK